MRKATPKLILNTALNRSEVWRTLCVKLSELGEMQIKLQTFISKNNKNSLNTFYKQSKALRMALLDVIDEPDEYLNLANLGRIVGVKELKDVYDVDFLDRPDVAAQVELIKDELKKDCEFLAESCVLT